MGFHVQDTGDGVSLGKGWKRTDQLPSMVQVATVSPIQPHVSGGMVVVISDWPARNADTRALVPSVLFCDVKLQSRMNEICLKSAYRAVKDLLFRLGFPFTFQMKHPEVMPVVARP